jgi:hypothetical protein
MEEINQLYFWIYTVLPEDGEWWNEDSYEKFKSAATKMLNASMNIDDIKEILSDLYSATSNEYK